MKKLLILCSCFYFTFCSNSEKRKMDTWKRRANIPTEKCVIKDSLIYLNLLDSLCSCKNVKIGKEEFCDSLLFECLKKYPIDKRVH